ncbi:MAG: M1 family metallopeptidase, partial [Chloroflexota bacterium]
LLSGLGLLLAACALDPGPVLVDLGLITPTPTPDLLAHYRAALQPAYSGDIEAAGLLPRYHITSRLDDQGDTLSGVMQVIVPAPGPELVFRLYPNLDNYRGVMQVSAAQIDGQAVEPTLLAGGTAIRLAVAPESGGALPDPATVELNFTVQLGRHDDADYTLFGWDRSILSLPGFYPTLAVQQNGDWVLDQPPPHADVLFNEVALYQLDLALPRELVVVASGVTLNVIDNNDGSRTWQIAGGPLRDMTVITGPFQAVSELAAGATVTSYYRPGHEAAAQAVLAHAAASLRLYSDLYGPYPYTELDVVEAPLNVRGMEYSGLVLIGEDLYTDRQEFSEPATRSRQVFLVAHEVAHQWWYSLIGNNPYQHPWLDEGLTEYSAFDYYRGVFGQSEAERLLTGRWLIPFDAAAGGVAGVVDRPASAFDPAGYELLVYAKSALFFNALRQELGEETYRRVLQTYTTENRYGLVTPPTLLATAERVSGQNLNPLAEQWLK